MDATDGGVVPSTTRTRREDDNANLQQTTPFRVVVAGETSRHPHAWILQLASLSDLTIIARPHDVDALLRSVRLPDCDAVVLARGEPPATPGLKILRPLRGALEPPPVVVVADDEDEPQ